MKKALFSALVLSFSVLTMNAITITSTGVGGNWNAAASWSPAQVPGAGDDVIVASGSPISVTTYANCLTLTVNPSAILTANATTNMFAGLTNNGTIAGIGALYFVGAIHTIDGTGAWSNNGTVGFQSGSTTINVGCSITKLSYFHLLSSGVVVTNNGTVNLNSQSITLAVGASWIQGPSSSLTVTTNITGSGSFDPSGSGNTVSYGSSVNSVRPALTSYHHLRLIGGGTKNLAANTQCEGNFTIMNSSFLNGNTFMLSLRGNWSNQPGGLNLTNVDVTFNGSATQTLSKGATYENMRSLTITTTGSTVTPLCNVQLSGNFTLNSGTFDVTTSNRQMNIAGSWINNGGTFNPRSGLVNFFNTAAQSLTRLAGIEAFYAFQKINGGVFTLTSNISVSNNLTIGSGTLACAGGQFIFLAGSWINSGGTFSPATSTVFLQAAVTVNIGKTIAGTETFNNLTKATSSAAVLTSAISCAGNFIHASGTINVSTSNFQISVGRGLTLNGNFMEQSGKILMNGTVAQSMSASIGQDLYDFEVSNSSTGVTNSSGTFRINNSYTPTLGNLATSGTGRFFFVSNSTRHAFTGSGPGTYSGTGYFYQRFISARAANWYDLATPVPTTVLDWDNEIYMSGVGGADGNACCPTFFSVTTWDEPSGNWTNITSTATALTPPVGYTVFLGDDLISWLGTSIIDVTGTPISGTQAIALSYTGASPDPGGNVIGNGQNAFIDWTTALAASPGVDGTFYLYDATGNYVAYGAGDQISPHQGFWVYATAGSQTMNLTQGSKVASSSPTFLRTARIHDLSLKISSPALTFTHEIHIDLDETSTNGYDNGLDSRFVKSPMKIAPNLTMVHNGNLLLVKNTFPAIEDVVIIPVRSRVGVNGVYSITANGATNIDEYNCVLLKDLFTGEVINLVETPSYSFDAKITDDPDRFVLYLIRKDSECDAILKNAVSNEYFSENQVQLINDGKTASLSFDLDLNTPVQVGIYNSLGQLLSQHSLIVGNEVRELNLPSQNGVYLITILVNGNTITKKAVINR